MPMCRQPSRITDFGVGHFQPSEKKCRQLSIPVFFGKIPAQSVGQVRVPRQSIALGEKINIIIKLTTVVLPRAK